MTDEDPAVTDLLGDLTMELRRLNREVEPEGGPRLPTREELSRLTSEVAIPALILLLKTQIRALQLLRRAIRIADGREPTTTDGTAGKVRDRAEQLGQTTLAQLDVVLDELQAAVEARPDDERAQELIDEARAIQGRIRSELDAEPADPDDAVAIDVENELQRLKDDVEGADDGQGGNAGAAGGNDDAGDGNDAASGEDDAAGSEGGGAGRGDEDTGRGGDSDDG